MAGHRQMQGWVAVRLFAARFSVEMGYDTTLLTDAVATFSMEEHKASVELDYRRIAHNVTTADGFWHQLSN